MSRYSALCSEQHLAATATAKQKRSGILKKVNSNFPQCLTFLIQSLKLIFSFSEQYLSLFYHNLHHHFLLFCELMPPT